MNTAKIINIKPVYKETLVEKVEKFRALDREIKKLTKLADSLKVDIISSMDGAKSIFDEKGHEIATYTTQTRSGFDKNAFDVENPGVLEKFTTITEMKVFRLK